MKDKRLIVNADDFGISRGVTEGILRAHRDGMVTSTSLMVNQAASDYAVQQLSAFPRLGVGIHLNLDCGRPVLPPAEIPSLVTRDGTFHSYAQLARKLWTWQASPAEIEAEFRAQIRWMKSRGITPTHADSHHHVHMYPAAARAFHRAVKSEGLRKVRTALNRSLPKDGTIGGPHDGPMIRRVLVSGFRRVLQSVVFRDLQSPDFRVCFLPRYRYNRELLEEGWRLALANLPPGTFELACHPGIADPAFPEENDYHKQREIELRLLTDPEIQAMCRDNGIQLITYNEI
ncbi:MAG TPA: ChbG/HpnK family deacetylase [Terriglobia bacterium]|jgi:predicted glycoside hydrolase/deacetylase ChbG (UPF0249 family)|nr:ChbG/HpnK family deacetylase [Terriglobia bacterium]